MPANPDEAGQWSRIAELEAENAELRRRLEVEEGRSKDLHSRLQHRVRNLLSVLNAISRRTSELSRSAEDYALHLDARFAAITRAQNVALRDAEGRINLEDLVAEELLANTGQEGEQVEIGGPRVQLKGRAADTLWLAVHELAVNSVKYGALSAPRGRITVSWEIEADASGEAIRLEWRERGLALPPQNRRGFGTEVIERTLSYELGASGSLSCGADEVFCSILLPVDGELVSAEDPFPQDRSPWHDPVRTDVGRSTQAEGSGDEAG